MNGYDYVYRRPEGMADFLAKFKVSVTYGRQGGADDDTKTRPDIAADMAAGICRSQVVFETEDGTEMTMPSLYSNLIYNWKDVSGDLTDARAWRSFGLVEPVSSIDAQNGSALNATQTANSARDRFVSARILYRGWAGDPTSTRQVNNTEVLQVRVVGYPDNPPQP